MKLPNAYDNDGWIRESTDRKANNMGARTNEECNDDEEEQEDENPMEMKLRKMRLELRSQMGNEKDVARKHILSKIFKSLT